MTSAVVAAGVLVTGAFAVIVVDVNCFIVSIIISDPETSWTTSSVVVVVSASIVVVVGSAVVKL